MIKGGLGTCDSIPFTEKSCENEKVEATKSDLGSENKIKIIDNWWISNPPLKLNEIFVTFDGYSIHSLIFKVDM